MKNSYPRVPVKPRACSLCNQKYQAISGNQKYCSENCSKIGYNESKRIRRRTPKDINRRREIYRLKTVNPNFCFSRYKRNAKQRNIKFEISLEEYRAYWKKNCHYCGGESPIGGIDRVDNTKGYQSGNIVGCCFDCNSMKGSRDYVDFIEKCKKILRIHG